jgi:hypothetical protein
LFTTPDLLCEEQIGFVVMDDVENVGGAPIAVHSRMQVVRHDAHEQGYAVEVDNVAIFSP